MAIVGFTPSCSKISKIVNCDPSPAGLFYRPQVSGNRSRPEDLANNNSIFARNPSSGSPPAAIDNYSGTYYHHPASQPHSGHHHHHFSTANSGKISVRTPIPIKFDLPSWSEGAPPTGPFGPHPARHGDKVLVPSAGVLPNPGVLLSPDVMALASGWRDPTGLSSMTPTSPNDDMNGSNGLSGLGQTTHPPQPTSSASSAASPNSLDKGQNVECVVCGDKSSGKHYGEITKPILTYFGLKNVAQ